MDIYYRRNVTWCKWPWNDEKETDVVEFSTSKRKFNENKFLECEPQIPMPERKKLVAAELKKKVNKINLVKTNNIGIQ